MVVDEEEAPLTLRSGLGVGEGVRGAAAGGGGAGTRGSTAREDIKSSWQGGVGGEAGGLVVESMLRGRSDTVEEVMVVGAGGGVVPSLIAVGGEGGEVGPGKAPCVSHKVASNCSHADSIVPSSRSTCQHTFKL